MKYIIIVVLLISAACGRPKDIIMYKLEGFSHISGRLVKTENFIVNNFQDDKKSREVLDSLVYSNMATDFSKYHTYNFIVYKESSTTNPKNLKEDPKAFDEDSPRNDRLFKYMWTDGKFVKRFRYENDTIVEE